MNWIFLILWFLIGFVLTNGIKLLHLSMSSKKLELKASNSALKSSDLISKAYRRTLLFHPIYYLIIWILCSIFYLQLLSPEKIITEALITGLAWWALVSIFEMLLWVIMKHRFRLTWIEMYKNSQPWISIDYYIVLVSPLVIALIL